MRRKLIYVACTVAALVAVAVAGQAVGPPEPLVRPDWAAIFGPDGTVLDLHGGVDAIFLEDKISDGIGIDMTVLAGGDTGIVNNGVVAGVNDLGNGYAWARRDALGNLQIYAGVERLDSGVDTYVEFEFDQGSERVLQGVPWTVYGAHTPNDVLVRVNIVGGAVGAATLMKWDGSAFQPVTTAGPGGAGGPDILVCVGAPPQESVEADVWDGGYNPVQVPSPNSFVEVGINVAAVLGTNVDFTSIQVRTAEDVILGSFAKIGQYAAYAQAGGGQ